MINIIKTKIYCINIIESKCGYYITQEDLTTICKLSKKTKKHINIDHYFNAYIIYELLLNQNNNKDDENIIFHIKDKLTKYGLEYQHLIKKGLTKKGIFIFFYYYDTVVNNSTNLEHIINNISGLYRKILENINKKQDLLFNLKLYSLKNELKLTCINNTNVPSQIFSILSMIENNTIVTLPNMIIHYHNSILRPIMVNSYYIDILYISNANIDDVNDTIFGYRKKSTTMVNDLQRLYGKNVKKYSRVVSENNIDSQSQSILNIIYNRTCDGSTFIAGDNMVGVIVVHKNIMIPKSYIIEDYKKSPFVYIISSKLNYLLSLNVTL